MAPSRCGCVGVDADAAERPRRSPIDVRAALRSTSNARATSGAADRAAASASTLEGREQDRRSHRQPPVCRPARRVIVADDATGPVRASVPGEGLISTFIHTPLRHAEAHDVVVARDALAGEPRRPSQAPASRVASSAHVSRSATATATGDRATERSGSCIRIGTSSAVSITSNSTARYPWAMPARIAASVFSGASEPPPRCAMRRRTASRSGKRHRVSARASSTSSPSSWPPCSSSGGRLDGLLLRRFGTSATTCFIAASPRLHRVVESELRRLRAGLHIGVELAGPSMSRTFVDSWAGGSRGTSRAVTSPWRSSSPPASPG